MSLLELITRQELSDELRPLWDECEQNYPAFKNLYATMANSPIIFRHIWGELIEIKKFSPVEPKHFELAVVVASSLMSCNYCVSHHSPRLAAHGYNDEQMQALDELRLSEKASWDYNPLFDEIDNLVLDLAYHLVWSGTYAQVHNIHPKIIQENRLRIFEALKKTFSNQQIEELVWRTTQCVAFNWHNEFFEIDIESSVQSLLD